MSFLIIKGKETQSASHKSYIGKFSDRSIGELRKDTVNAHSLADEMFMCIMDWCTQETLTIAEPASIRPTSAKKGSFAIMVVQ